MAIASINPANGTTLKTFTPLTAERLEERLALAAKAFREFQKMPVEHRALCMRKLATLLEEDVEDLAQIMMQEMGKPLRAGREEIEKCAMGCRYYAENTARILAPEAIATDTGKSYVRWDPLGVILAVMPWNYPFWQVFRFLAPALMAGNVGLLKHAPSVPQCALAIETLTRRAGFPRGTFQTLLLETEQIEGLIADPRVAAATVTGSQRAGRAVAAKAGSCLKKTVLELGGSDPFIVMPTADLAAAVDVATLSRTVNSGQSCIAAKRFIVHAEIYMEFVRRFSRKMAALKVGDPSREDTEVGPLASARGLAEVERQVAAAVQAGGKVIVGGGKLVSRGFYFEPTVIVDVPRTSAIYREEIFGPVAMVFSARDVSEAIEIANDTEYGLGASVWTRDPAEQQRMVAEIEAGMVFLNAIVASDPRMPFGGVKGSGYGRELSAAGMREFLNAKSVVVA
jgi:succinate-semialdehyde dehydrogenase / glutarate-semialdehyde dehydrogenase